MLPVPGRTSARTPAGIKAPKEQPAGGLRLPVNIPGLILINSHAAGVGFGQFGGVIGDSLMGRFCGDGRMPPARFT